MREGMRFAPSSKEKDDNIKKKENYDYSGIDALLARLKSPEFQAQIKSSSGSEKVKQPMSETKTEELNPSSKETDVKREQADSESDKEITPQEFLKRIGIDPSEFLIIDRNTAMALQAKVIKCNSEEFALKLIEIGYVDEVLKHIDDFGLNKVEKDYVLRNINFSNESQTDQVKEAEQYINEIIGWNIDRGLISEKDPRFAQMLNKYHAKQKRNPEYWKLVEESADKERLKETEFWGLPDNTTTEELRAIQFGFDAQREGPGTRYPDKDKRLAKSADALSSVYEKLRIEKSEEGLSESQVEDVIKEAKKKHVLKMGILRLAERIGAVLSIHNTPEEDRQILEAKINDFFSSPPKRKAAMDLLEKYYGYKIMPENHQKSQESHQKIDLSIFDV